MVKNFLFIVILSLGIHHEYVGINLMNNSDVKKTDTTWKISINDESSCVTYSVRWEKNIQTYVVDFMNKCNKAVDISYEYYSDNLGKWITSYAYCRAGKTSYDNPAGKRGKIRNVKYE